jgi:uncharacterized protein (DUF302 family)
MSSGISYQVVLSSTFDKSKQLVKDALKEEGFGVLTEIDVKATLKDKLGKYFRPYTILGACNPPYAHQALLSEPEVGIMLPCNVTLDEREEGVLVSFANPEAMLTFGEFGNNPQLRKVAALVNERIVRVVNSLRE